MIISTHGSSQHTYCKYALSEMYVFYIAFHPYTRGNTKAVSDTSAEQSITDSSGLPHQSFGCSVISSGELVMLTNERVSPSQLL